MKKILNSEFTWSIITAWVILLIVVIVGCEKENFLVPDKGEVSLIELDATLRFDEDRNISLRSVSKADSVQAIIDSLYSKIEELEKVRDSLLVAEKAEFFAYSSGFRIDLAFYGATNITKIRVLDRGGSTKVEVPISESPQAFAEAVKTVISSFESTPDSVHVFSTRFESDITILDFNLYAHVPGLNESVKLNPIYLEIEFNGDARYDLRLAVSAQPNRMYVTDSADESFEKILSLTKQAKLLEGVVFDRSQLRADSISQIAEAVLEKEQVGRLCLWRSTNLPDIYQELFEQQGWNVVIVN